MTDAFIQISRQEGVKALYSGYSIEFLVDVIKANLIFFYCEFHFYSIWPAVLRQATYGTIKFGTYYTLKKFMTERGFLIDANGNERVWCNVLCAVAGQFTFLSNISI